MMIMMVVVCCVLLCFFLFGGGGVVSQGVHIGDLVPLECITVHSSIIVDSQSRESCCSAAIYVMIVRRRSLVESFLSL